MVMHWRTGVAVGVGEIAGAGQGGRGASERVGVVGGGGWVGLGKRVLLVIDVM